MSLNEVIHDKPRNSSGIDRPASRDSDNHSSRQSIRLEGFAAHDEFKAASRKPGLAIFDYEEGESI